MSGLHFTGEILDLSNCLRYSPPDLHGNVQLFVKLFCHFCIPVLPVFLLQAATKT